MTKLKEKFGQSVLVFYKRYLESKAVNNHTGGPSFCHKGLVKNLEEIAGCCEDTLY
jgi:hypothetical protein